MNRGPAGSDSRAVIIGVSEYDALENLPTVLNSAHDFANLLRDKDFWGLEYPEHIKIFHNPDNAGEVQKAIDAAARAAKDTFVLYFAGHGLVPQEPDGSQELALALRSTSSWESTADVLEYRKIRNALRRSRARSKVVILDCCYSGLATDRMSPAQEHLAAIVDMSDVDGTYVMTACEGTRQAVANDGKGYTAFTGQIIETIRAGLPDQGKWLQMGPLFDEVDKQLESKGLPRPVQGTKGRGHRITLVRNRWGEQPPTGDVPTPPPPSAPPTPPPGPSWRLRAGAAAALVAALLLGATARPGAAALWQQLDPRPAAGRCSDRASLLSFSDALDKKQINDEQELGGLSALALTGGGRAYALTDNATALLFPLRLGPAQKLTPRVGQVTTLSTEDGPDRSKWYDGEGLVVEHGGKTALVASETGPRIQRFSISTGKPLGRPFPIPKEFRLPPKGDAMEGRTLESLTASPDGHYLYAGMEGPLSADGDKRGRNLLRIQRYRGRPGGAYKLDKQYAYETSSGMYLADLAAVGKDRLLALERQYVTGIGNSIRIYDVPLHGGADVQHEPSLYSLHSGVLQGRLLVNLADCPAGSPGQVPVKSAQINPLLGNVEGMAIGAPWTTGPYRGRRPLYLVSDDNGSSEQITRLYALSVRLPAA